MVRVHRKQRLWYSQPASGWEEEALPIGNGSLGGMIFGGVDRDRIQFNEESLFSGKPSSIEGNPYSELSTIRGFLEQGDYAAAQLHAESRFLKPASYGDQSDFGMYQNFGDIILAFDHHTAAETSEYVRELDLDEGVARVSYRIDEKVYRREYFCSYPDKVMAVRLHCNERASLHLQVSMKAGQPNSSIHVSKEDDSICLSGSTVNLQFQAKLKVILTGGTLRICEDRICIHGADTVTLLLTAATSYLPESPDYKGKDFLAYNESVLASTSVQTFERLLNRHTQDHKHLFTRVTLEIAGEEYDHLPTNQRIVRYQAGDQDVGLEALLFQYGRYLLIGSSRPGTLPANLQGIWNDSNNPEWGSMFCYNINFNMNYWLAQTTNLAECHEPMIAFIDSLRESGRVSAQKFFNARGWFTAKKSDIWGFTQPYAKAVNGLFIGGAGWLCDDVWDVYSFNRNLDYLRNTAYPIMKESAEFYLDYLTLNRDGYLISSPSTSPENSFRIEGKSYTVSDGCEMDHRIIQNLFTNCMKACELLNIDPEFYEAVAAANNKIAPVRIGKYGQIQEWYQDWDNPDDKHRHISQLYGLHPAQLITPFTTPEWSEAARVTLNCRSDGKDGDDASTGWSRAWKINCWSRLLDGNRAYKIVRSLIRERLNPNLFCTHPPFQIDGNLGYTAGIAEMLVQSNYQREIHLLPALPDSWQDGAVKGLRARGNFTVDISWQGGKLSEALISGKSGEKGELRYRDRQMSFQLDDRGTFLL